MIVHPLAIQLRCATTANYIRILKVYPSPFLFHISQLVLGEHVDGFGVRGYLQPVILTKLS